jgi:hypothetical protein
MKRREFLQRMFAVGATAGLAPLQAVADDDEPPPSAATGVRKVIVVQFGGGTRYCDTVGDPGHRHIPRLWNDLVPRGTLFTNMRVEGKVVHPNSTGSMMTGHWEWADLDWSRPVAHPTIFEVYRRTTGASDLKAWAFMYASILAKAGESLAPGFGPACAANVVVPPTIPRSTAETMDRLMAAAAASGNEAAGAEAAKECAALARETSRIAESGLRSDAARAFVRKQFAAWKASDGSTSHDTFLTDGAIACMKEHAPDVLAVCLGEIDCAHYGSWSRYVEAIARTDALTWRLWETAQSLPAYQGRTLMLILPDHGRELDSSDGLGFVHHSDFYTNAGADEGCRRVWMLALGPDVPAGRVIEEAIPITSVAATGLEHLGCKASEGAAKSVWDRLDRRTESDSNNQPNRQIHENLNHP